MDREELDLTQPLRDDLSALYRADVRIPTDVDGLITNRARAHFARTGRTRWIRWTGAAAAVAAIIVGSIVLVQRPEPVQQAAMVGDTTGDGIVDIRDALALARSIQEGSVDFTSSGDVNNDRVIDRNDVDAIAMMSVRLDAEVAR